VSALDAVIDRLCSGPILWLPLTLAVYAGAATVYRRAGQPAALNPTLLSIMLIGGLLLVTDTPYSRYFDGVGFLHYLLGPTVVALAVPLYRNLHRLRGTGFVFAFALLVGCVTSVVTGLAIASSFGTSDLTALSLAPRSATTAVSMQIAALIGGLPEVTAVLTIATGVTAAVFGPYLLNGLGIKAQEVRGFALGVTGHGIATARAFHESQVAGSFASLGMGLNAIATAVLVPPIVRWAGFNA
jgi:predicted murein hydrolase (TIGR00659 family)